MAPAEPGGSAPGLEGTDRPLLQRYDGIFLDLDGVVFHGTQAIPGAAETLKALRAAHVRVAFVTNNAARTPDQVAEHLCGMGIEATASETVTAPMAAAQYLTERWPPGAAILVVGGAGITEVLQQAEFRPVHSADQEPVAVVQGWAPDVGWRQLAEAAVALRAGSAWIATNLDATLPSERGPLPGNGSLVAALATATGQQPVAVGKPQPALFRTAVDRTGSSRPLMVGDRLETDVAGAHAAGLPALCVLSGVSGPAELLAATVDQRPDYLGRDLRALELVHPCPSRTQSGWQAGGCVATVRATGDVWVVTSDAEATPDGLDALRALCALTWSGSTTPDRAAKALDALSLDSR